MSKQIPESTMTEKKKASSRVNNLFDAEFLLGVILDELGCNNVKAIGYVKGKWAIKWRKGKQNKFDSFDSLYEFLKTEGNE